MLLSLSLDGGDALRLASRLRAEAATRDVPVLLVADAAQKGLVLRGFDLGANDHVLRPVDPNELRARVRNQIRRKRYQERLRAELDRSLEMAVTDPLTGLRNRRYVPPATWKRSCGSGGAAVLLIDVDRFKAVNDTHGHAAGDAVLREVAERVPQPSARRRRGGSLWRRGIPGGDGGRRRARRRRLVGERLRAAIDASADPVPDGHALHGDREHRRRRGGGNLGRRAAGRGGCGALPGEEAGRNRVETAEPELAGRGHRSSGTAERPARQAPIRQTARRTASAGGRTRPRDPVRRGGLGARRDYLILASRNATCLRATGSYFFSSSLPVAFRVFFFVT